MRKIAIDISQIIYGTGVSNLTMEQVAEIVTNDKQNQYTLFGYSIRGYFKLKSFVRKHPECHARLFPVSSSIMSFLLQKLNIPIEFFCPGINIFHTSDWITPRSRHAKIIVPIYDLTTKLLPENHEGKTIEAHELRIMRAEKYADCLIFLSQSTKKDFFKFYSFSNRKTEIVYPATTILQTNLTDHKARQILKDLQISTPFILSVSTLEPRKNLETLIQAYEKLGDISHSLVIVGPKGWGSVQIKKTSKIIQTGFISRKQLVALYRLADVFVYPSYYEGFGLPVIEAMSFGLPTICASTSSLPEAGGDAAIYFNPKSVIDLSQKINKILKLDKTELSNISRSSKTNAQKFSWKKSALKIISIYESA